MAQPNFKFQKRQKELEKKRKKEEKLLRKQEKSASAIEEEVGEDRPEEGDTEVGRPSPFKAVFGSAQGTPIGS